MSLRRERVGEIELFVRPPSRTPTLRERLRALRARGGWIYQGPPERAPSIITRTGEKFDGVRGIAVEEPLIPGGPKTLRVVGKDSRGVYEASLPLMKGGFDFIE